MKRLMRKIIQSHLLRVDELSYILMEIEAVLNFWPLIPIESTDLDDLVLTPGHFLIGRPIVAPLTTPTTTFTTSILRRWQLTQRVSQDLWHTWMSTYLQAIDPSTSKWEMWCSYVRTHWRTDSGLWHASQDSYQETTASRESCSPSP